MIREPRIRDEAGFEILNKAGECRKCCCSSVPALPCIAWSQALDDDSMTHSVMGFDEISHVESEDHGNIPSKDLHSYTSGDRILSQSVFIFQPVR